MANKPDFTIEESQPGTCCGIDEAGRGPLVGAVLAACVYIPEKNRNMDFWLEINDSKKLNAKKRDYLFSKIKDNSYYGIAEATIEEIDKINILNATMLAMKRSYENMSVNTDITLIDGNKAPAINNHTIPIIKGDSKSISIAAASILAKVTRDNLLKKLSKEHPQYGWERNSGYGTKEHIAAIEKYGITPYHRKTFAPVKKMI